MKLEQFTVTLSLSPEQVNQLSGLTRFYNDRLVSEGRCPGYTECSYLERFLSSQLTRILSDELDYYKKRGLAGDVPTRNPSPDEAGPEEPGADGEEEEPETLVMVRDASGVVREVTLDEAEEMREAAQGIYAGEPPEPDFDPYAPEEEPETVSNAEDKRSPLIKDNSDRYFYYLEHGHWPSDDEVLAGADVPCTGDYGLSDCLVVTQSALDFVDSFFVGREAGA